MADEPDEDEENEEPPPKAQSRYRQIIKLIFERNWRPGITEFTFERDDIEDVCSAHSIKRPKNLGDVIYSFRYRQPLPDEIVATQPATGAG
jgi:hypothetical protein